MMKSLKSPLAAFGLAMMASLAPSPSQAGAIQLNSTEFTVSNDGHIQGAAQTSDSILGLGEGFSRAYSDDLSSSSDLTVAVPGINDAGSLDDNYVLVHNGGSAVDRVNLSTGFGESSSSVNGTGVSGISSAFTYNNAIHFAAIDSQDDTVKFFEWGNSTPVAIGPNVGSNYTGLEVVSGDSVTDLSKLPILVSRDFTDGAGNMDQYYNGVLTGEYQLGGSDMITDISYNPDTGVLSASSQGGRARGGIANYDFSEEVVPEPATIGLFAFGALAAYLIGQRQR